jgi:hypothetical protein
MKPILEENKDDKTNVYNITEIQISSRKQRVLLSKQTCAEAFTFFVMGRQVCLCGKCWKRSSDALSRMNETLISSDGL